MAHLRFLVSQDQPNKSECKKIEEARTGDSTLSSFPSFFYPCSLFFLLVPTERMEQASLCHSFLFLVKEIFKSPQVRESKTALNSGFNTMDSRFHALDSLSVELGLRIP